ncbi:hypothetical protein, partial [Geobacter sp.]|uniref:hypothetical protein n=1 Tax=Geobacter sp. TaxID=46610 RepID=UPI002638635F
SRFPIGKIYLTDNPSSRNDFTDTLNGLQNVFGTSKQAVSIRIMELNIFIDNRYKRHDNDKEQLRAISLEHDRERYKI